MRRTVILVGLMGLVSMLGCDGDGGGAATSSSETSGDGDPGDGDPGDGDGEPGDGDGEPGDGDGEPGDGDGEPGDGDGEPGDGDGEPGDGDGEPGDGDGEPGDGDGDGDGPLCLGNDCTDGVEELDVHVKDPDADSVGLVPGDHVRVFGVRYPCPDSPCSKSWIVMRDMSSGEFVLATFGHPVPTPQRLAEFGETLASWLAPLTFEWHEYGLCEPFDAGCGNGTVRQRAAVQFTDGDVFGRVLDSRTGWAPRGYHVIVRRWESGDADCQYELWPYADMSVHRTQCEGEDCPAPTVATSCEPELPYASMGFVYYTFGNEPEPPLGGTNFDLECLVLDVVAEGPGHERLPLDCVPSL